MLHRCHVVGAAPSRLWLLIAVPVALLLAAASTAVAAVGRTAGSFNVSTGGSASYSIPIFTPPGPRGMQPGIALTYSSSAGIGEVGKGWAIAGLSAISRCGKTRAQDGANSPVLLATSDGYCLNGSRLRLTSGTYGTAGSTYQTEIANFSHVAAVGTQGNGPSSFTVNGKDGLTYEYGTDGNSKVAATGSSTVLVWMLRQVSDRANNRIRFTYVAPDSGLTGTTNPSTIEWTPTYSGSGSFQYSMAFTYSGNVAESTETGQVAGTVVKDDDLLTAITVSNGGSVVRKYVLAYNTSPTTGVKRLETVTECSDSGATDCLSPTTVTYQDGTVGVSGSGVSAASYTGQTRDFNGDGFDDLLYANGSSQLHVAWGASSGYSSTSSVGASGTLGQTALAGDILGTGQDDVLVASGGYWYRYYWNGGGFASGGSTGVPVSGAQFLVDSNRDGKAEVFKYNTSTYVLTYRLNNSSGGSVSFAGSDTTAFDSATQSGGAYIWYGMIHSPDIGRGRRVNFDFDGDGKEEVLTYVYTGDCWDMGWGMECYGYYETAYALTSQPSGAFTPTMLYTNYYGYYSPPPPAVSFLRVNDDACTDVVFDSTASISTCNGLSGTTYYLPGTLKAVMDWDGDGRRDVLSHVSGSTLSLYRSQGASYASAVGTSIASSCVALVADPNGDGLDDLGCSGKYYLHNGVDIKPDLATSFADGYGVTQTVAYTTTTRGSHTKQSDAADPNYDTARPITIAATSTHTDGIGGTYTNTYWYYGAALNREGRGFAGFAAHKITDSRNSAYTVDYFNRTFPYSGSIAKSEAYQSGGIKISERNITLASTTLDATSNNQRYFVYSSGGTSSTYEVSGTANGNLITQTSDSRTYDSYGNVTASTSTVTDKDASSPYNSQFWTTTTSASFSPNTTYWCLGLPTSTQVIYASSVSGETSVTRSQGFTPDYPNCRMSQQVTEPSSSTRKVESAYSYDSFGNVSTISVTGRDQSGNAMTARTSSIGWGTTGQFPVSETNALSQTTTRTFSSTFGELATETDANGIVVASNTFDAFGRTLRSTRADGTSTLMSYAACATYGCQNGDPSSGSTSINKMIVIASERDTSDSQTRDSWTYLDQFDRTIVQKAMTVSGGYSRSGRQFDALGRVYRETAPCDAASCTAYWVTNAYDLLGRISSQSRPQSQSVSTPITTNYAYAGRTQTVTDPNNKVTTKILDVRGNMRRSQDHNSYYQVFNYDGYGSLKQVSDSSSNTLFTASYTYGIQAFQDSSTDMDLGARSYTRNSLGELVTWTDAKSQSFGQTYDALSRVTSRTEAEGVTSWTWGTSSGSYNIGRLASVSMTGYSESYTFDNKGRLSTQTVTSDQAYGIDYAYTNQGLLDTLTYPTSTSSTRVKAKYGYQYGVLKTVTDWTSGSAGTVYWAANSQNARGQTTQETLGNGIVTTRAIDAVTGMTSSIQSGVSGGAALQNHSYLYDLVGNVTQRQESNLGLTENFYYDSLYRLTSSTLNSTTNLTLTYDAMGNIQTKSDVNSGATWTYDTTKKHAVKTTGSGGYSYDYDANGNMTSRNGSTITWASYNYPTSLAASGESTTFYYNPNRQYYKQVYSGPSGTETTHYIGGMLEKVALPGGTTDWRHYVTAEGQTVAVVSRLSSGTNTVSYPLEDHMGSAAILTNSSGTSVVKESFGAFGLPRNGSTWSGAVPSGDKTLINGLTRRGYTFHSMLGDMGLIHMNGRVQDSITGRFMSPDPTVPNPGFTQSFNRYSYVNNNPLSFVDPSGFAEEKVVDLPEVYLFGSRAGNTGNSNRFDFGGAVFSPTALALMEDTAADYRRVMGDRGGQVEASDDDPELEEVVVTAARPPGPPQREEPLQGVVGYMLDGLLELMNKPTPGCEKFKCIGGAPDLLGGPMTIVEIDRLLKLLRTGSSSSVRMVDSSEELGKLYEQLSAGGKALPPNTYPGARVELPDGTRVGLRSTSDSGGATIDVEPPSGRVRKVHIEGGK